MTSLENRPITQVIIIGAGFSGLAMACQLQRQLGSDDYIMYDRSAAPGGAWWANRYPGCAVDIPAVFYSLSFAPNPFFTKVFPSRAEILEYFNSVAKSFDVHRHVVPNTEWEGAYWQDSTSTWIVKLKDLCTGDTYYKECKILISAVGGLVDPNQLNVPGIDDFKGEIIHTAQWRSDISLRGKDVIVLGNGCSAAQLIPAIADEAKSISQFIRTPQYYLQNENFQINKKWQFVFAHIPAILLFFRTLVFLFLESTAIRFNVTGNGQQARKLSAESSRAYVRDTAPEKYWPLLMPQYEIGCKRRIFDNSRYLSYLQRSSISLTDDPITNLLPHSIMTKSGTEYPADIIVLATGFSLTQYNLEIVGRNSRTRAEHWDEFGYKEAYKSVAMAGFPNFFFILGPNSGKGHTSTIYSIENCHANRSRPVFSCRGQGRQREKYNDILHDAIGKTIFNNSCFSYFIDQKTQRNWFTYPWSSFRMWYDTHTVSSNDWIYSGEHKEHKPTLFSASTFTAITWPIALFVPLLIFSSTVLVRV